MKTNISCSLLALWLALGTQPGMAADAAAGPADYLKARPEVVEAWKDMRFGMFVCWGPVSLTGLEIGWSRANRPGQPQGGNGPTPIDVYDNLYKKWKPEKFVARQWVRLAQDAGAKYMIFLVKHHDGFCLYDTKLSDHKITGPASAWKHDVMKDIAAACHEAGLKLIIYYSQPDWHHADYKTANHARYNRYFHGQVRELLSGYGRIDGLWFDLGGTAKEWETEKLFKMARSIQPWLIINDRVGLPGDFGTPENQVGHFDTSRPWETNATLGHQWSWKPHDTIRPLRECLQMLVVCACGDGNFALNTGPMPDGQIEPQQAERFREIGQWLNKYGESFYGTRGGPLRSPDERNRGQQEYYGNFSLAGGRYWGGSTHKGNAVYLHILRWPTDTIQLPVIGKKVVAHSVLTGGQAEVKQSEEGITVSVPAAQRAAVDTIVKLELDGPAADIKPTVWRPRSGSLAYHRKAVASNVYQNQAEFSPDKAFDDDPYTRWGCDWGTKSAWLEVDLGKLETIGRAHVSEPYDRVKKFELQHFNNGQWQTLASGSTIGESLDLTFPQIAARRVRLNLLKCTEGPSIWEFQLFPPSRK